MEVDTQPEAGPSRPYSPPRSPLPPSSTTEPAGPSSLETPVVQGDVHMEEPTAVTVAESTTLAQVDGETVVTDVSSVIGSNEDVALLLNFGSAAEPRPPEPTEVLSNAESSVATTSQAVPSIPFEPQPIAALPIPPRSPSPSNTHIITPEPTTVAPPKPKTKRKRNAQAGPSSRRRTSASVDPDRPPHWMGEDNTIIRCICGFTEDDGFTIQCEGCGAWEHGMCFGYLDEMSAPETYFCELCDPRPVDAAAAMAKQITHRRANPLYEPRPPLEAPPEKDRAKVRGKGKRARSVIDGEAEGADGNGKDTSPGVMGPPTSKPRRKPAANRPRAKPTSNDANSASGQYANTAQSAPQAPSGPEIEDDYFTVQPWLMEYTPVKDNVVRSRLARQIMGGLYREWVDADVEELAMAKRSITTPSGLPSPTETGVLRLSPDNQFSTPDFNTLAPPIPPIFMSEVPDIDQVSRSITVRAITQTPSFLPLNYAEVHTSGVYSRPAIYGVCTEEPVSMGACIGEYRGEVIDCESYRRDPINQYAGLGTPKPFVRSLGPPVNLMIDSRAYGNDLRFVRSSCHPNAVLRPLLIRSEDGHVRLKFGLFASRDISKKEEITLGWEWDDQHVVHALKSLIYHSRSVPEKTVSNIVTKFDAVLNHLYGTFTSCACPVTANCALSQMRSMVQGRDLVKGHLGELIGAVRGWRRREMDVEMARKWSRPDHGHFASSGLGSSRSSLEAGESSRDRSVGPSRRESESVADHSSEKAESEDEASLKQETARTIPGKSTAASEDDSEEEEEVEEDIEEDSADESIVDRKVSQGNDDSNAPSPEDMEIDTPQRSPAVPSPTLSSSLSSALPNRSLEPATENEIDDGDLSDATTATLPRSQFSEAEDDNVESLSPQKPKSSSSSRSKPTASPKSKSGTAGRLSGSSRFEPVRRPKRQRTIRIVSSSASESDDMDIDSVPAKSPKHQNGVNGNKGNAGVPLPKRAVKGSPKSTQSAAEPRAVVPDQVVAPMSMPMDQDAAIEEQAGDEQIEGDQADQGELSQQVEEVKPKEPTPPPPEPPKKIPLSEYLKTRKFRKDTQPTPSTSTDSAPTEAAIPPSQEQKTEESQPLTEEKPKTETEASKINFLEFLPSSRPGNTPSGSVPSESPRLTATPSSYVPRSDYFPLTAAPPSAPSTMAAAPVAPSYSFVPRASLSYTPRQATIPLADEGSGAPITPAPNHPNAYVPRANGSEERPTSYTPRQGSFSMPNGPSSMDNTPPGGHYASISPNEPKSTLPPVLASRELPPHQANLGLTGVTPTSVGSTSAPARAPPTGPKVPPTGPRGSAWNPPASPATRGIGLNGMSPGVRSTLR